MVRRRAVALLAAAAAAAGAETSACKRGAPRGITLVTQTSVERLRNLRSICERWTGDISVAVYVEDAVEERRMAPTVDAVTRPCRRAAVAFVRAAAPDEEYPVNRLRNVAWRGAATSHVFVVDVDFWPGAGARAALEAAVAAAGERTAIVAPAFSLDFRGETRFDGDGQRLGPLWGGEKTRTVNGSEVPATLDDLLRCLRRDRGYRRTARGVPRASAAAHDDGEDTWCHPFHHHGSTRFARWRGAAPESNRRNAARSNRSRFGRCLDEPVALEARPKRSHRSIQV